MKQVSKISTKKYLASKISQESIINNFYLQFLINLATKTHLKTQLTLSQLHQLPHVNHYQSKTLKSSHTNKKIMSNNFLNSTQNDQKSFIKTHKKLFFFVVLRMNEKMLAQRKKYFFIFLVFLEIVCMKLAFVLFNWVMFYLILN